jgi:hypothetical protein
VCTDVTGECIVSVFTDVIGSSLRIYQYHNPERHNMNETFYIEIAQEVRGASYFMAHHSKSGGTRWRIWLRHCAISRKVVDSIPDGVTGIFH